MENSERRLVEKPEKIFFAAGNIVEVKHNISNKPRMFILSIDKVTIKDNERSGLLGVTCMWFSTDGKVQKERFSTKDIVKVDNND